MIRNHYLRRPGSYTRKTGCWKPGTGGSVTPVSRRRTERRGEGDQRACACCVSSMQPRSAPPWPELCTSCMATLKFESDVLRVGKGERPSFESLMSQKAVDYRSTGLESVMEEGMSSNGSHAEPFLAHDSLSSGVVELSEVGAR
jgi:hypothetical protein